MTINVPLVQECYMYITRTLHVQCGNALAHKLIRVLSTYLAFSVRAATPDMSGVEALVPVKSSVHLPFRVVVV